MINGPLAWRVRWSDAAAPGTLVVTLTFAAAIGVRAEEIDAASLLAALPASDWNLLDAVFLPAGGATPFTQQEGASAWMARHAGDGDAVEALYRDSRVSWRPGRALMTGPVEHAPSMLAALAAFALWQARRRRLSDDVDAAWARARLDIPLSHAPDRAALRRQSDVNAATKAAVEMRMSFVELQRALAPPAELPGMAQRVFNELTLNAGAPDQLVLLDDMIEIIEDLYATANDRLTEYAYFRGEHRLELIIVLLLALQFVQMLVDLWYSMFGPD